SPDCRDDYRDADELRRSAKQQPAEPTQASKAA
ncbi:MAG: hypothetical protein QOJ15_1512, partial [Bradyrhizobium sp.]|nr:hypothetical protein [Bradyrhizobium sp.]